MGSVKSVVFIYENSIIIPIELNIYWQGMLSRIHSGSCWNCWETSEYCAAQGIAFDGW